MIYSNLDELRAIAKEAGIPSSHMKKEETLLTNLKGAGIEVEKVDAVVVEPTVVEPVVEPIEEVTEPELTAIESLKKGIEESLGEGEVIEYDLLKSQEMQENGYEVVDIKGLGFDKASCHILKKVKVES